MRTRHQRVIATLSYSTAAFVIAAFVIAAGLGRVRADELRTNQKLLEDRVDQLAAVGQNAGTSRPFSVDMNTAAGAPVTAGSFPRSILIPGTDTSRKVYGQITEILDYQMSGGNPNQGNALEYDYGR